MVVVTLRPLHTNTHPLWKQADNWLAFLSTLFPPQPRLAFRQPGFFHFETKAVLRRCGSSKGEQFE